LRLLGRGRAFGHFVFAVHHYESHRNDAERRQQQQAAGIAAGLGAILFGTSGIGEADRC
jgi:hypothetical protein